MDAALVLLLTFLSPYFLRLFWQYISISLMPVLFRNTTTFGKLETDWGLIFHTTPFATTHQKTEKKLPQAVSSAMTTFIILLQLSLRLQIRFAFPRLTTNNALWRSAKSTRNSSILRHSCLGMLRFNSARHTIWLKSCTAKPINRGLRSDIVWSGRRDAACQ